MSHAGQRIDALLTALSRERHWVLLLGVGEQQPVDYNKRLTIKGELIKRGYVNTILGEEVVRGVGTRGVYGPLPLVEDAAFRNFDSILVVDSGPAPLAEIAQLSTRIWFRRKAVILVPSEFKASVYGRRNYPSEIVALYRTLVFYNIEERDACDLTGYCCQIVEADCIVRAQEGGAFGFLGWPRE